VDDQEVLKPDKDGFIVIIEMSGDAVYIMDLVHGSKLVLKHL
jgi:hypothetical protein